MPRCTWCGVPVPQLTRQYGTALKLADCGSCGRVADPLLERDVVFLWLHALLLDLRVFRHLVHNIHHRGDALAHMGWKTLMRVQLFVLLISAAYLELVKERSPLRPALEKLAAQQLPPFPEYHPLMLPLASAAVTQCVGWVTTWLILHCLTRLSLSHPRPPHKTAPAPPSSTAPTLAAQRALLVFQLSQLWLPSMATVCLFARTMHTTAFPSVVFGWTATFLHLVLAGILFHVTGDTSLYTGWAVALLLVLMTAITHHHAASWLNELVT
ncbi:hypothetical protein PTSG_12179 [Salpingoeca rosetta]|uniref:Protein ARV n=1 Tax=Salpingoeca rosetta (strain ATCC 50818 / BSB-021) TaxID=946362 RepID=F2U8L9_SALR5|nr:uncharacterized protein PTSG_12179 [Salpingoeca rosetta]EGD72727.1 hypothetical protein PTSG_12179 [Salpingoeca rosetta]|eukprot:XP_004994550.1 hypothetical protein PTSG_12179 [Salpingoeca rosetta]